MAVTLADYRKQFYDILREEQNTSAYPLTFVDQLINASEQRICSGRVVNPLTKEEVRKGNLPFINTDLFLSNIQTTSLSVACSVGATTLTVADSSNYPNTGNLFIAGNIIPYTGNTGTGFTGCSNVLFPFDAGQEVSIVFALPEDFMSPINLVYNNLYQMPAQVFDDIFENLNQNKVRNGRYNDTGQISRYNSAEYRRKPFYSIKDMQYLILFNANKTGDLIRFRYEKQPPLLVAGTDTSIISKDIYARSTVPYLAVGEMLFNRGEEQRGGEIINFAIGQIREMYNYYNNGSFQDPSGGAYRTAKGNRLNV